MKRLAILFLPFSLACGSNAPPPQTEDNAKPVATVQREAPMPVIQQELGSIDERGVEVAFQNLGGSLEKCHTEGRDRVELLAGDVRVFMRIGADGKAKYGWFEHSTLGERATEKCILSALSNASWPKPIGGEAEVRHQFGWEAGQERQPTAWAADKVTTAIDADPDAKRALAACKAGSELKLTAYVVKAEHAEPEDGDPHKVPDPAPKKPSSLRAPPPKKPPPPKNGPRPAPPAKVEVGMFRSIGVAAATKQASESADCVIDAISKVKLPSPGSYAAKVTFRL